MARPRSPIGTFGEVHVKKTHDGRARALTRFQDDDGRLRRDHVTADTPQAAEHKLQEVLAANREEGRTR